MLRLLIALIVVDVLSLGLPGLLIAQTSPVGSGRVVEVEIAAPALSGNLLGTPDRQGAAIYLPPSYDSAPQRRYPVIYLLHGVFDDYVVWLTIEEVPDRLDRLITTGSLPEILVVMPNGGNRLGGGYYRNSPISGNWEDYIADDLIGYVDEEFRTLADADGRAIVGHSMGGYGALHLAINRPDLFSAIWSMSPCCLAARDDFGFGNDAWKRAVSVQTEEDIEALMAQQDFFAVALLGVMSAFSTEVGEAPIYAQFPFDIQRGEVVLDDRAHDSFLDSLPSRQVHSARANLRNLRGLGLDVGLGDQFLHIPPATIAFSQILGAERIPHRLEVYDGDHRQEVGDRLETVILPWIGSHLSPAE